MIIESKILSMYKKEGFERGGIITKQGLVEFTNQSITPEKSCEFSPEDVEKLSSSDCLATWHTHPNKRVNLTMDDYYVFISYPNLKHYIVGKEGLVCYSVKNGALINEG